MRQPSRRPPRRPIAGGSQDRRAGRGSEPGGRRLQGQAAALARRDGESAPADRAARSPTRATTASPNLRAISWPSPTIWRARWGRSMRSCARRRTAALKALLDGVELTERELLKVLEKHGVEEVRAARARNSIPTCIRRCSRCPIPSRPAGTVAQVDAARLHDRRARVAAGAGRGRQGWAEAAVGGAAGQRQCGRLRRRLRDSSLPPQTRYVVPSRAPQPAGRCNRPVRALRGR